MGFQKIQYFGGYEDLEVFFFFFFFGGGEGVGFIAKLDCIYGSFLCILGYFQNVPIK